MADFGPLRGAHSGQGAPQKYSGESRGVIGHSPIQTVPAPPPSASPVQAQRKPGRFQTFRRPSVGGPRCSPALWPPWIAESGPSSPAGPPRCPARLSPNKAHNVVLPCTTSMAVGPTSGLPKLLRTANLRFGAELKPAGANQSPSLLFEPRLSLCTFQRVSPSSDP